MEEYEKNEEKLRTGNSAKNYPFDFFFERATNQRKAEAGANENEEEKASPASQVAPDIKDRLGGGSTNDCDWSTTDDSEDDDFEMIDNIPELKVDSFEFVKKDGEVLEDGHESLPTETTTCTNHDKS